MRTTASSATCRSWMYEAPRSLRITRSTDEALDAPVFVRLQELAHQRQVLDVFDPQQHDGQVARDALRPQADGAGGAAPDHVRGGRARRRHTDVARELLERLAWRRPCRGGAAAPAPVSRRAWRRASRAFGVAMLVGEIEHLRRASRATQVQNAMRAVPPAGTQAITQREHRIEHGAGLRRTGHILHGRVDARERRRRRHEDRPRDGRQRRHAHLERRQELKLQERRLPPRRLVGDRQAGRTARSPWCSARRSGSRARSCRPAWRCPPPP